MGISSIQKANQLYIGVFGKRNSGKSTVINALTGQKTALVSDIAGTTTNPEYKRVEIEGIGACILIDTAGFDDSGYQEQMRVDKTRNAMEKTDVALVVCADEEISQEVEWIMEFKSRGTPVIVVINKVDQIRNTDKIRNLIYEACKEEPIKISAISKLGAEKIREEIIRKLPEDYYAKDITGDLVSENDIVLLVMLQDTKVLRRRMQLSQVQVFRELLDKKCIVLSSNEDKLEEAIKGLSKPPELIIADSSAMDRIRERMPAKSRLISFSDLFKSHKEEQKS
jgi:[FeFe] hydrogenase H-cluster maturation GTPase HydF